MHFHSRRTNSPDGISSGARTWIKGLIDFVDDVRPSLRAGHYYYLPMFLGNLRPAFILGKNVV